MAETKEPFEYRLLRRPDVPSYIDLVLLTVGKLERSTGLDRNAESMIRSLSRRSVWAVLRFLQLIGRPFVTTYVAADGNRIVGTGTLLSLPNAGYVAAMATAPEFRGRGVASRILTLLHKEAARRHRDWLVLDVDSDNDTAIRVYRRAGYREVARFAWYLRTGLPPTTAPVAPGTPPATKAQLKAVAPSLDAGRAAEYPGSPSRVGQKAHPHGDPPRQWETGPPRNMGPPFRQRRPTGHSGRLRPGTSHRSLLPFDRTDRTDRRGGRGPIRPSHRVASPSSPGDMPCGRARAGGSRRRGARATRLHRRGLLDHDDPVEFCVNTRPGRLGATLPSWTGHRCENSRSISAAKCFQRSASSARRRAASRRSAGGTSRGPCQRSSRPSKNSSEAFGPTAETV